MKKHMILAAGAMVGVWSAAALAAPADDRAAEFYKGKQITVYSGYAAGGGYDIYTRLMGRYFGRFVPGNPSVIVQNRPGAGSIKLANEMTAVMPVDGSAIGIVGDVLHIKQVLGETGIRFVAGEFKWIGRMAKSDPVFVLRPDSPATTIEGIREKEVLVGVPGAGSATAQTMGVINRLLGTKFKLISGYPGSTDVRLALERGEVHGSGSVLWGVSKEWVRQNNLVVLYQVSIEKYADLPDIPRLIDLARNDDEARLLRFFGSYTDVGRSFMAPPKLSDERTMVLRAAFGRMTADPEYRAEAKRQNIDLDPMSGQDLQNLITDVTGLTGALLTKAKEVGAIKDAGEN